MHGDVVTRLDHFVVESVASSDESANVGGDVGEIKTSASGAMWDELTYTSCDGVLEFLPYFVDISVWRGVDSPVRARLTKFLRNEVTKPF